MGVSLDQRVTIQSRQSQSDALGQPVQAWLDVATLWADVRYVSGAESIRADGQVSVVKASVRIRRRSGLSSGMRVLHKGATLEVCAVLPERSRTYVDLVCEGVQS